MSDSFQVTEESLRSAMRDPRYWRAGHPERDAYFRWVSDGWQAYVQGGEGRNGIVHVRAYSRARNGKTENVAAHTRSSPPGGDDASPAEGDDGKPRLQEAQLQLARPLIQAAPRITPGLLRLLQRARPLWEGLPSVPRPSLLEPADETRRGFLGSREWYTAIPEQEGEREATNAPATDAPGQPAATPDAGTGSSEEPRPRYTIHPGQQGKHIPGHNNHDPNGTRSDLSPDVNPQGLIDRHAGRGETIGNRPAGEPGARERFDTGNEVIGIFRDETGRSAPTTRGTIHYAKNGRVHIVPARPRDWIEGGN